MAETPEDQARRSARIRERLIGFYRDRYRRCPVCDGKQTVRRPDGFDQDCPRCKGEGEVPG